MGVDEDDIRDSNYYRKFRCHYCSSRDMQKIATTDDGYDSIVYVYWCNNCFRHSGYRVRVEIVRDPEGRI